MHLRSCLLADLATYKLRITDMFCYDFGFYVDGFKDVISEGREFGYDFVSDGVFYVFYLL